MLGWAVVFLCAAQAYCAPFYLEASGGPQRMRLALFDAKGKKVLVGQTDAGGRFLARKGPPAGSYLLKLYDQDGARQLLAKSVKLDGKGFGLATVVRADLGGAGGGPGGAGDAPVKARGGQAQAKDGGILAMLDETTLVITLFLMAIIATVAGLGLKKKRRLGRPRSQSNTQTPPDQVLDVGPVLTPKLVTQMEKDLAKKSPPAAYRLGQETFTRLIHRGGVGSIYAGLSGTRPVAIKIPHSATLAKAVNQHDIDSIHSEFQNCQRFGFDQSFIRYYQLRQVTYKDDQRQYPIYYCTMEYINGAGLDQLIKEGGLDSVSKDKVAGSLLQALKVVHNAGVVHKDIKPANVLVVFDPTARTVNATKLIDFGAQDQERKMTMDYASPEQHTRGRVGPASDIFSLGLVLYELYEGVLPFGRGSGKKAIPSPDELGLSFSRLQSRPKLMAVITRMLKKDPAARYAGGGQALDDFAQSLL